MTAPRGGSVMHIGRSFLLAGACVWPIAGAALAQSAAPGASTGLAEIVVTARFRTENAEKIAGSISVVGPQLLERSYTVNTQELSLLVPSLNYSSANPRNTAFTIRGLGSSVVAVSQANDGLEPGVGFYVDGVYHARPATAAFDFTDIDQIEVLRGPQGTLFGKNSTAGAITVTSRAPVFTPEASGELSYGNLNFVQAKATVSGPIIDDKLAFRVAAQTTDRDGDIHNTLTGHDQNNINNQAVRGQLLFTPDPTLNVRLIADYSNFQSECCTQVYLRVAPTLKSAARQYPGLIAGLPAPYAGYAPPSLDPYDRETNIDALLNVVTNEGGVEALIDKNFGFATLTSISAWRYWNWDAANDRDYTGLPIQTIQHIPSRQDQYSQEIRLASNGQKRLSYVGGLYFFHQEITGEPISIYGPLAAYYLIGPTTGTAKTPVPGNLLDGYGTDGHTDFISDSYAAFGEVNWRPIDPLTITGGLRYTYEEKTGTYATTVFGGLQTTNTALNNAKLSILRPQSYAAAVNQGSLTGRFNVAYQVTSDVLGYVSFANGAKSGGINESGLPLDTNNNPVLSTAVVKPENNVAYEVGLKSNLFDHRLILNLDGFYTDVKDFQANVTDTHATVALRTYLANIPKVTVKGLEADAIALVTPNFQLRGSLAYDLGKYDSYPNGPCPIELIGSATTVCNLSGRNLSGLPKWVWTYGGDYTLPLTAFRRDGEAYLHADATTRSASYGDPTDSIYTVIRGYTVVNATLGYRASRHLEIALFVRNLLDQNYIQNVTIQAGNSGLIVGTPSDPRTFGITLRARQ